MATERDLGPLLSARLTYLRKRTLVDLEDLHAEHPAPVGSAGASTPSCSSWKATVPSRSGR